MSCLPACLLLVVFFLAVSVRLSACLSLPIHFFFTSDIVHSFNLVKTVDHEECMLPSTLKVYLLVCLLFFFLSPPPEYLHSVPFHLNEKKRKWSFSIRSSSIQLIIDPFDTKCVPTQHPSAIRSFDFY